MAVSIEFFSVVVPKQVIQQKYAGGLEQYKADVTNASYVDDEYLTRVAFMHPAPLDAFCETLIAKGLHFDEAKHFSTDFVVVQSLIGKRWITDWLILDQNNNKAVFKESC
ncbi:MAG: hypothetical protein J5I47_02490 [Vicingus serpentipes]|nr:hypothetical protein [Vicingus serpentipes]